MKLLDWLLGPRIATHRSTTERIGPLAGVGVLGLDALASAAYGPEALLTVLLPLGRAGLVYVLPLTLSIVVLLAIVTFSYRQTLEAYPNGGGAYTVAKENLGTNTGLLAGAALALDYVLNVAVAVSAGVSALASAVPRLLPHTLPLCLLVLLGITLINLRGVRTTGKALALPTACFVLSLAAVIGWGLWRALAREGGLEAPSTGPASATAPAASAWLLLRAFANGCTAMTGVEAVSNGVPLFKEPAPVNARRALTTIVAALVLLLLGIALLASAIGITATPPGSREYESVLSRAVSAVVGRGPVYYFTMASVIAVLLASANTSFADFPRVCRMLASDRFLPEPFMHRGRRLTYSHGIVVLALLAAMLLVAFAGVTDSLIPLFAVGALLAFTLSQAGMIAHWRRRPGPGSRRSLALNALGLLGTGSTLLVVLTSKLLEGAWISLVLVAGMVMLFTRIRRHYGLLAQSTATRASLALGPLRMPLAVVPLRRWDVVTLRAMRFAIGVSSEVTAVQVLTGDREVDDLSERWDELVTRPLRGTSCSVRLVVLRSQYRELYGPLLELVRDLERQHPDRPLAVIVPELIERRWYHRFLHNQTAALLKALLLFRGGPQTIIVSAPVYLPSLPLEPADPPER